MIFPEPESVRCTLQYYFYTLYATFVFGVNKLISSIIFKLFIQTTNTNQARDALIRVMMQ